MASTVSVVVLGIVLTTLAGVYLAVADASRRQAGQLRRVVAATPVQVGGGRVVPCTLSIGIARLPQDNDSIWKVIKYADMALYEAKSTGRDKIVEFSPEMFEGY